MLLFSLVCLIAINAVLCSTIALSATDEVGFKRKVLLAIAGVQLINLAAFLTIYATTYGISH